MLSRGAFWMRGSAPVPYAPITMGADAVPIQRALSGPVQTHPRLNSKWSPGAERRRVRLGEGPPGQRRGGPGGTVVAGVAVDVVGRRGCGHRCHDRRHHGDGDDGGREEFGHAHERLVGPDGHVLSLGGRQRLTGRGFGGHRRAANSRASGLRSGRLNRYAPARPRSTTSRWGENRDRRSGSITAPVARAP